MSDRVIYFGVLLVGSFAIFNGALMLLVPHVHRRFLSWVMQADSWSRPAQSLPQRGSEIERRLTGLALAGMGLYFAWGAITGLMGIKPRAELPSTPQSLGGNWLTIIIGIGLSVFGIYAVNRPESLLKWNIKHQPTAREVPESTLRIWRVGARTLGAAFVWGGLYIVWIALGR